MIERLKDGSFDLQAYVIDRGTRIYVPLVPAVALTWLASTAIGEGVSPVAVMGNLLGFQGTFVSVLHGNAPLWTLAYEIWFYALAGAFGFIVLGRRSMMAVFLLVIGFLVFSVLDAGMLLIWILGAVARVALPKRFSIPLLVIATSTVAASIAGTELAQEGVMHLSAFGAIPLSVWSMALGAGFCLLVVQLVTGGAPNGRLRAAYKLGTPLSAFSYTLYLTHYPVLMVLHRFGDQSPSIDSKSVALFAADVGVSLAVAAIMYWLFERRTAAVRARVRGWMVGRAPNVPDSATTIV